MRLGFVVVEHRSVPWKKQIWMPFLKIVEHLGAEIFVMKNVPRLLGSAEHDQINEVAHALALRWRLPNSVQRTTAYLKPAGAPLSSDVSL